ncbi:rab-GTPase-TBC domain-containing protein [Obelidium mucronatum]|nr:rab-GTPase-TBC domain-containing protein [Obelidium mucronatum]
MKIAGAFVSHLLFTQGGEKLMQASQGLYSLLTFKETKDRELGYTKEKHKVLEFIDVLERDLHRTFPENILFNGKPKEGEPEPPALVSPTSQRFDQQLPESGSQSPRTAQQQFQTQHVKSLRNVLVAFAYYSWPHPDESRNPPHQCTYRIGYCQSLNFIAGLILLVFLPNPLNNNNNNAEVTSTLSPTSSVKSPRSFFGLGRRNINGKGSNHAIASNVSDIERAEERAFWTLVAVVERLLPPEMYGASLEGAQIAQEVLWKWLLGERGGKFGVGKVAKWVDNMEGGDDGGQGMRRSRSGRPRGGGGGGGGGGMPPLSLVTTSWFMTVFINVLPIETVMRVWDCFCYQGEKVLMRVTLTLLKIHEDEVLACSDTTDAWRLIKEIPPRMIDAHKLMDICFKPRVNLNIFEGASGAAAGSANGKDYGGSSSSSLAPSTVSVKSLDSDDDYMERGSSVSSIHRSAALMIPNDPLRKFSEKLAKGGAGSGVNGGGKVPKRGVGSVSSKMIEHYRALALSERRKK